MPHVAISCSGIFLLGQDALNGDAREMHQSGDGVTRTDAPDIDIHGNLVGHLGP